MKLLTSFLAVTALSLAASAFAQDESPSPTAEETPSTTVETTPQATTSHSAAEEKSAATSPTAAKKEQPSATGTAGAKKADTTAATESKKAAAEPAAKTGKKMSPEATIKDNENRWVAAYLKHDAATVEPMVAADFIGVNAKGKVQNRRGLLAEVKSTKETYTSEKNEKLDVRMYGTNVAVVVGTAREKGTDKDGKTFDRTYRYTDTWMERGGDWQCIASQVAIVSGK